MFIYVITNAVNGKMYVGQTIGTAARRWRDHRWNAKNCVESHPFARAIRKYGPDQFSVAFAPLPEGSTQETLDLVEQRMIRHFGTMVPCGYNIKVGGSGGPHHEETRRKIGAKALGRKHSEETKALLSSMMKGRKGYPRTPEANAKFVASRRAGAGWNPSEDVKAKISATLTGRKASDEFKLKQRESHLGKKYKPYSAETSAKLSALRKGRPGRQHTVESKAKISEARMATVMRQRLAPVAIDHLNK